MMPNSRRLGSLFLLLTLTAALLVLIWLPTIHPISSEYFEVYRGVFQTISGLSDQPFDSTRLMTATLTGTLASIFDSPFFGLQLSTLISVISLWSFALAAIWSLPPSIACGSSAVLIAIAIYGKTVFGLDISGSALVQQVALDQLINQTLVFAIVAICLLVDTKKPSYFLKLLVLSVGIFLLRDSPSLYFIQAIALAVAITIGHSTRRHQPEHAQYLLSAAILFGVLALATTCHLLLVAFRSTNFSLSNAPEDVVFSFTITSVIFASILLSAAGARLVKYCSYPNPLKNQSLFSLWTALVPIITLYILVAASMPSQSAFDVRIASRIDDALLIIQRINGAKNVEKNNVLVGPVANLPPVIPRILNYALATTGASNAAKAPQDLIGLARTGSYHWLLTDDPQVPFFLHSCVMGAAGTLSAYGADCIIRALREQASCEGKFDLSKSGHVDSTMFRGLSEAEDHGRWTDGNKVYFGCIVRGAAPKRLVLDMRGFIYGPLTRQRVIARVNGNPPQEFLVSSQREIALDFPTLDEGSIVIVDIVLPDAISPRNLGLSIDARHLAVTIKTIDFVFD